MPPMSLLTGNSGIMITWALLIIGGLFRNVPVMVMARQGFSVRPMLWLVVILGLSVIPQFAWHLHVALRKGPAPKVNVDSDAWWTSLTSAPSTTQTTARYFGVDATDGMTAMSRGCSIRCPSNRAGHDSPFSPTVAPRALQRSMIGKVARASRVAKTQGGADCSAHRCVTLIPLQSLVAQGLPRVRLDAATTDGR
jgi:hypothetical protein